MAKIIWKELSKDDPIFNGGFVISSFPRQRVLQPNKDEHLKRDKDPDARAEKTRQQTKDKSTSADVPNSRKG